MSLATILKSLGENPSESQLKTLTKEFSQLTVIDLSNQNLNANNIKNLISALLLNAQISNTSLTVINLSGNEFGRTPLDMELALGVDSVVKAYPNLKHLYLGNTHIDVKSVQEQEAQAQEQQETLKRCLRLCEDMLKTLEARMADKKARDEAIKVGQTPPITTAREISKSRCLETKSTCTETSSSTVSTTPPEKVACKSKKVVR